VALWWLRRGGSQGQVRSLAPGEIGASSSRIRFRVVGVYVSSSCVGSWRLVVVNAQWADRSR